MMYQQTKFCCKRISSSDNILKSHILIILSLTVILSLKTANHSFWKTIWLIMMHYHTKFGRKNFSILKRHIMIILSMTVTLTLKTANQSFQKTLWLIMMHHHKSLVAQRFIDSENIIWTNIYWQFEILLWPWLSTKSNFSIKHSGLW